jgi:phosphoribosylformylglycinamidine cyclo-ligase
MSDLYRESGVDLDAAEAAVRLFREAAERARRPEVVAGVGGFAGAFRLEGYRRPLLVAAADGVGTKVLLAREAGMLDRIGQDLAAMVLNDLVCLGARPLFFLDYLGVGRLDPEEAGRLVAGLAAVLADEGCALLGGETAELPGLYREGDFDFVGFGVGAVEADELVRPAGRTGDVLIGLPSSGFHANGWSLVRRLLAEDARLPRSAFLAEAMAPTRLYVRPVRRLLERLGPRVRGLAHITGGGLPGNVPRALAPGFGVAIEAWPPEPEPMRRLREAAGLTRRAVAPVWNLGVGFVAVVAAGAVDEALAALAEAGESPFVLGRVTAGPGVALP